MYRKARNATIVALAVSAAAVVLSLAGCTGSIASSTPRAPERTSELRVSAATTLKSAFEQLAPAFEEANDAKLVFNFGASGVLQKQIEGGAPVDVFASASPKQVDALVGAGLVSADATSTFASNDLVIIVPNGNPKGLAELEDLAGVDSLATGNPDTAPHGTKAKEWLENTGQWVSLKPKFVFAENAAQTFDYVARGEVDAGIVFGSEAFGRGETEVVYTVPAGEVAPIRYVIAPVAEAAEPELAQKFVDYVRSAEGQKALLANGFKPAPGK